MNDTTVSRRTLAKGVAWTLPAVSIAAAAPSLAASSEITEPSATVTSATSFADKCQGNSQVPGGWPKQGYRMHLVVDPVDAGAPDLISVTLGNGKAGTLLAGPTAVAPGVWEYAIQAQSSPSSLVVGYTIDGGAVQLATIQASPHCGG